MQMLFFGGFFALLYYFMLSVDIFGLSSSESDSSFKKKKNCESGMLYMPCRGKGIDW